MHPRVERFKNGGRKVVLLLGDPLQRQMHWNADLKSSVPCFKPSPCPFCSDPKFTKSERKEGFAPAMILNERAREWQQAVVVFTKGGLDKLHALGGAPYRGWRIEVVKVQKPGRVAPMEIRQLDPLPDVYPALPPAFNVRAVMMRVWFPHHDHHEPIEWIEPMKVERRPRPSASTMPMELDPENAVVLASALRARGYGNLASAVTQSTDQNNTGAGAAAPAPGAGEPPARTPNGFVVSPPTPATPTAAAIKSNLDQARQADARRRSEARKQHPEDRAAAPVQADAVGDLLADLLPSRNGKHAGNGGVS
jgi:hypothetical protein